MQKIDQYTKPDDVLGKRLWFAGKNGVECAVVYKVTVSKNVLGWESLESVQLDYGDSSSTVQVGSYATYLEYYETEEDAKKEFQRTLAEKIECAKNNLAAAESELSSLLEFQKR